MKKNGVLNEKLKTYYKDVNLTNYRYIFQEAITNYKWQNFEKILDIWAWTGAFLKAIEPFNFELYGLESSDYWIEICKKQNFNINKFFLEKWNKLPFWDNTFSLVLFNQVIEHLKKESWQYYIQEIIRILEPGWVAIIKSPSFYSKIWRTDPHHIYCWKPNELLKEVNIHSNNIENISLLRNPLEPWMMFKYNENIIDTWHKYNKYPRIKYIFVIFWKILDNIIYKITKSDIMLSISNITFVKK